MPCSVRVLLGPARSGKTTALVARYRAALADGPLRSTLWIAPTHRAAAQVRQRLLDGGIRAGDHGERHEAAPPKLSACFSPAVMTFDQFARHVVAAGDQPVQPISHLVKRRLIAELIRQAVAAEELPYFAPIAHTEGLLDLVVALVSELKRLEIWPEEFWRACQRRGQHDKDRELAALYEAYQRRLNDRQWYDAEGRFWTARALLRAGQRKPFERLRLVVVDGFTDFTRTQHEILEILAERVEQLLLTLPLESGEARPGLFAKAQATLEQLRERHPGLAVEYLARSAAPSWPAMAHVESEIFKNPRRQTPAADARGVEIIAAAGPLDELQIVGRRIKQLLLEGDDAAAASTSHSVVKAGTMAVRPGDMVVVFRSLKAVAPLVREVFDELGLPYALETAPTLAESPALRALLALVQLDQDDWPFRGLLALLTSNYFRPKWPPWRQGRAAQSAQHVIRRLQVPTGRDDLIEQTRRWAEQDRDADSEPAEASTENADEAAMRRARDIEHARRALPLLERLAAVFAKLPQRATPVEWGQAVARLAAETGLLASIGANPASLNAREDALDREAIDHLPQALSAVEQSALAAGDAPVQLDRPAFLELLRDILAHDELPHPHDETGRVRVLSAPGARALEIPYLFLAGLSEKAFPPADRDEGLYSEAEYQHLAEAGLPLVLRSQRGQEEMLLFYEVVTRATRRLCLSYPAVNDRGDPLLSSPYLAEIERACGEDRVTRTETADLSPVPQGRQPFSPGLQRVMAVDRALKGEGELFAELALASPTAAVADNIMAGLGAIHQRGPGRDFGPFEGMLSSALVQSRLSDRYGPQRVWSPSHLEQYAACPHQFFLERVLGLAPQEELALATDYRSRGARLHDAMALWHRRLNEQSGRPTSPLRAAGTDLGELSSEVLASLLKPLRGDTPLSAALKDVDRQLLAGWLERYLGQLAAYDAFWAELDEPLVPAHFEISFGLAPASGDPLSTLDPLVLEHRGRKILLGGRIDRIDLGQAVGRTVFNVLDYKSGKSARLTKPAIDRGEALQLSIYCMAAQQLLLADRRAVPWCIGYWFVAAGGFPKGQAESLYDPSSGELRPKPAWESLRREVVARVFSLVDGIRGGQFPMINADEHCTGHCDFHTVCRVNQARNLGKSWTPPDKNAT